MTRTKKFLTLTGVAVVAGAAGCALGLAFAPASGKELRRRFAWKAGEWRSVANSTAKFVERAAERARGELHRCQGEWRKAG
jgi:gas vesicle protein